jgi:hypothetical protein
MNPLIQFKNTTLVFLVRSLLGAATASLLMIAPSAQAGYIVTLKQVGSNVVATGSGAINLTGLTFNEISFGPALVQPNIGEILTGPTALPTISVYLGASGPTSFGNGGLTFANSGSGDIVGILAIGGELFVPQGYVSNTPLSDTSPTPRPHSPASALLPAPTNGRGERERTRTSR